MIKINNDKNELQMFSKTGKFTSEMNSFLYKPFIKERKTIKPPDFFENFIQKKNIIKQEENKKSNNKEIIKIKNKKTIKNSACFLSKKRNENENVLKNKFSNPPLGLYNPKIVEKYKGTIKYSKQSYINNKKEENIINPFTHINFNKKIKGFVSLDKQTDRANIEMKFFHNSFNLNIDNKLIKKNFYNFKNQLGHFYNDKNKKNNYQNYNPNYFYNKKNLSVGIPNMKNYSKRNYLKNDIKNKDKIYYIDLVDNIKLIEKNNFKLVDMNKMKKTNYDSKLPSFIYKNNNYRNSINSSNQKMLENNNNKNSNFLKLNSNRNKTQNYYFDEQLDFLNF